MNRGLLRGATVTHQPAAAGAGDIGVSKPRVLVFLRGYLPGYRFGGPLQSVANMADRLGDEFDFRIIAADRDLGSATPYPDIPLLTWVPVGKANVLYLPPGEQRLPTIARLLRETPHDGLYLNSFFDPRFSLLPLVARKLGQAPRGARVILAPRGEFSPGAIRQKAVKKRAFLVATRLAGLHADVIWQASTSHEAQDIRRTVRPVHLYTATDLPRRPAPLPARSPRSDGDPLRLVFLSRISPMKNLLFALRVLASVSTPVVFTIHGPREDPDYWRRCAAAIAVLPPNVEIVDGGPVTPAEVVSALAKHDVLFLPTLGENYGHVIAEALEAGLRLLISDRTPWRGLQAEGVGYDLPLEAPSTFIRAIETEAGSDPVQAAMNSYAYLSRALRVGDVIDANRKLLSAAVGVER